jgi:hypothetical protein
MSDQKQRHGCLTAYLILMIVANSATAIFYFIGRTAGALFQPGMGSWAILLGFIGLINLACAIALFSWKKWGFWGFATTSLVTLFLNLYLGIGIGPSLLGLVGIAILYGVLQIGNENKGWPQLE